jgi:hypothetical protein
MKSAQEWLAFHVNKNGFEQLSNPKFSLGEGIKG